MFLSRRDWQDITQKLEYDRSRGGAQGLALTCDVPHLGLRLGDRVEPSSSLWNVSHIFKLRQFPCDIVFWRCSTETLTKHRNPLIDSVLAFGPERILVDLLHALFLGVLKELCTTIVWELILSNAYDFPVAMTGTELHIQSAMRISVELTLFYVKWKTDHPDQHLTQIQQFSLTMVGSSFKRCCKTKGAETKGFFFFLLDQLRKRQARLQRGDIWVACAEAMASLILAFASYPMVMTDDMVQV